MIKIMIILLVSNCVKNINSLSILNKGINTYLTEGALYGNTFKVIKSLNNGVDVNFKDNSGKTALIWALIEEQTEIVNF